MPTAVSRSNELSAKPRQPWAVDPATVARIAERLLEYCEVGFTTSLVEMPAPFDRETIDRLATQVKPLVAKQQR